MTDFYSHVRFMESLGNFYLPCLIPASFHEPVCNMRNNHGFPHCSQHRLRTYVPQPCEDLCTKCSASVSKCMSIHPANPSQEILQMVIEETIWHQQMSMNFHTHGHGPAVRSKHTKTHTVYTPNEYILHIFHICGIRGQFCKGISCDGGVGRGAVQWWTSEYRYKDCCCQGLRSGEKLRRQHPGCTVQLLWSS